MISELFSYVKEKIYGKEPTLEEKIEQGKEWLKNEESQLKDSLKRAKSYKQKMLKLADETYKNGNTDISEKCCRFVARNDIQMQEYNKKLDFIRYAYLVLESGDLKPDDVFAQNRFSCYLPEDNHIKIQNLGNAVYRSLTGVHRKASKQIATN